MEDIRVNQLPWQMNQSMRINKDRHNLSVDKGNDYGGDIITIIFSENSIIIFPHYTFGR